MKRITPIHILVLLTASYFPLAQAQALDPSTVTLLGGANTANSDSDTLDSGRFTLTPKKKSPATTKGEIKRTPVNNTAPASTTPLIPAKTESEPPATAPEPARPSIANQVKVLVLGDEDEIEDFRKQIHPEDRRNNCVEISVAPSYIYNNSSSNYSFRNFTAQSPGFIAGANIWLSPFFGLHGEYTASFEQAVMSPAAKQMVPLTYQGLDIGLRFRKHFGLKRKSPSLSWGLDFVDRTSHVPSDTTDRVSTSTSGLSLSLEADIPRSKTYAHTVGLDIEPFLVHSETSEADIHSGGKNETFAVGAWVGGSWIFDRQHQVFWKLHERVEQNLFDGAATTADPSTGATPKGVSVTNGITIFSIGYRWGN